MRQKNLMKWKKKPEAEGLNRFINDFSLIINQFYCLIWTVEKIQKVKTRKLERYKIQKASKKPRFIKEQKAGGLTSSLGINTP